MPLKLQGSIRYLNLISMSGYWCPWGSNIETVFSVTLATNSSQWWLLQIGMHRDEGIGVKLHFRVQPGQLVSHRPFLHQKAEKNENLIFSEGHECPLFLQKAKISIPI